MRNHLRGFLIAPSHKRSGTEIVMNYKMVGKLLSKILVLEALFLVPSVLIALFDGDKTTLKGVLLSIALIAVVSLLLYLFCRNPKKKGFYAREGLVCVSISWIVMSLLGAMPFWITRAIPNYIDALFETVSGFTTTGASILSNVEGLSRGLLYWRSFTHWLGGTGVLVFLLAISSLGEKDTGYTMHLLRAESPGPNVNKLVPRMRQTAKILYLLYILLTILNIIFLLIGRMPVFDAFCTAFGTAGTGGFGIKNDSIASYSPYLQNVCTIFMLLFGVNFSCYYMLVIRQFKNVLKDEELRLYIGIVLISIVVITLNITPLYNSIGSALHHAAFQVSSIITTTGFATTDFDLWPSFSKTLLLCLMLVGACAGSTGGGFKCGRLLLLLKGLRRNIRRILHPNRVQVVRINGQTVSESVLDTANAYLAAYVLITFLSFLLISLDEFSVETNLSAVFACFNNIGPGLDAVGPTMNYGAFGNLSKIVLILNMLAGRLEIFPMLILASRSVWRSR